MISDVLESVSYIYFFIRFIFSAILLCKTFFFSNMYQCILDDVTKIMLSITSSVLFPWLLNSCRITSFLPRLVLIICHIICVPLLLCHTTVALQHLLGHSILSHCLRTWCLLGRRNFPRGSFLALLYRPLKLEFPVFLTTNFR